MEVRPLEVYAEDSNYAVVRAPGRRFPGSLIQGDSLDILCSLATSVAQRVEALGIADEELRGDLEELQHSLMGRLLHLETVLRQHGLPSPVARTVTPDDFIRLLPEGDTP
jgi:hypothetical protein